MSTVPRRSARIAALPTVTRYFPCGAASKIPRQTQKPENPAFRGLSEAQVKEMRTNIEHIHNLLNDQDKTIGTVNRAAKAITIFEYVYNNTMVLLRIPKFRTVLLNKLKEECNHNNMNITLAQRDALNVLYGRISELVRHLEKDPLYIA